MPLHHTTTKEKDQLLQRKIDGETVSSIAADIGIPKSTVYAWIAEARKLRQESAKNEGGSIAVEHGDIIPDGRIKNKHILLYNRNHFIQAFAADLPQFGIVIADGTGITIVGCHQQIQ